MQARNVFLISIALASLMVIPSAAIAVSSSSSSASSGASSSSSISLGSSNVLGALALGAGGRHSVDRADVARLAVTPFLASDPCVATMRIHSASPFGHGSVFGDLYGGGTVRATLSTPRATESMQIRLARSVMDSNGTLTEDSLARMFAGQRDKLVLVPCEHAAAMRVSEVLMGRCVVLGRGCQLALSMRVQLDANGIDEQEKALIAASLRR